MSPPSLPDRVICSSLVSPDPSLQLSSLGSRIRESLLGCLLGSTPGTSSCLRRSGQSEKSSCVRWRPDKIPANPSRSSGANCNGSPQSAGGRNGWGFKHSSLHQSLDAWRSRRAGLGEALCAAKTVLGGADGRRMCAEVSKQLEQQDLP